MKYKVIRDCFYKKVYKKAGEIIEADFKKNEVPSWAKPIETKKRAEKTVEKEAEKPVEKTDIDNEILSAELEALKDIAIDHNIIIDVDPNMPLEDVIEMFKAELSLNGIGY